MLAQSFAKNGLTKIHLAGARILTLLKPDASSGQIGFISLASKNLCRECDSTRLTSDGNPKVFGGVWSEKIGRDPLEVVGVSVEEKKQQHVNIAQMKNRRMVLNGGRSCGVKEFRTFSNVLTAEDKQRRMLSHFETQENRTLLIPRCATHNQLRCMGGLSHTDAAGRAKMVDISRKKSTKRVAVASGRVVLGSEAFEQIVLDQNKKGDVLTVANLAGVMGAKECSRLIPLCHNILLSKVNVELSLEEEDYSVKIVSTAESIGQTGVEMEALTAVSIAALTVYDMCKAVTHNIVIKDVKLLEKHGGKSDYRAN